MKKMVKLYLVLLSLCFFLPNVALANNYPTEAAEKFVSGIANIATGVVELPKNMIITSQYEGVPYGMTVGFAKGIIHTVGRTLVGALDVVTFFIPVGPSLHPRYIWEDFSRETTY